MACNARLSDGECRAGHDLCHVCKRVSDECSAEQDYSYDREFVMEDVEEGVRIAPNLDYYDNLDAFSSDIE
jgi:hypothetical protein